MCYVATQKAAAYTQLLKPKTAHKSERKRISENVGTNVKHFCSVLIQVQSCKVTQLGSTRKKTILSPHKNSN